MPTSSPAMRTDAPRFAFPALVLANVFLALGPTFVRLADVGPVSAAFWRLALALPVLAALAWSGLRRLPPRPAEWAAMLTAGLLFAGDLAAWHLGILDTKIANATLFANMSALLLPLWALLVLRQRPARPQAAALVLAALGAAALMGGSYELSAAYLHGDLLCLLAGTFYTAYLLIVQGARRRLESWSVLAVSSMAGAPALLLCAWALGETVMPGDWTPVVALALSSQLVGQGLLTYAMGYFSPLVLGLSLLLQPAMGALLGWLLFGEWLTATDLAGTIAVAVALVLVRLPARA
ncbi:drug/metabolite transporter (DMT)-like permease [Sphingobium sp. OAS761]|uniref:DMT family transporter n=1 Tax=Sphingobium sp. OAS761 TaxID=2817901 RepID=UPI00209DB32E|nr:DMT family transporter [Sphingobium sp. OAS761]MCP1469970.1 drug/metabolite transporter (DMT)-like permease [Sphingobium sp. OAS761]